MFQVRINDNLIAFVENLLKEYNFGKRGFADGNYLEQRTGLIGQTSIQRLFGVSDPDGRKGFDGGNDFVFNNLGIDVKTMGRTTDPKPEYVNNFIGLQKEYPSDIIIFCSFNKKTAILTVCGWIVKKELFIRSHFYPQGSKRYRDDGSYFVTKTGLFEIENYKLNSPSSFKELRNDLLRNDLKKLKT